MGLAPGCFPDSDWPALVIDNGSGSIKYGEAGLVYVKEDPRSIIPAVVGRNRSDLQATMGRREYYVGDAAQRKRSILNLKYPIEHGVVTDWDDMERIWEYVLHDDMAVDTREHPLLMTEPPRNPTYGRQKMSQILFETFGVPALHVAVPAILSRYASGRPDGLFVDSGAGSTHMLAIIEGVCIWEATHRTSLAGREMTNYLMRLLNKRGYSFSTSAEREIVREIKERHCYVSEDYDQELSANRITSSAGYTLPDGQRITLGRETFQCMEAMFRPSLLDVDSSTKLCYPQGIADMVHCCIHRCHADLRETLYNHVHLSGGNTMHRGFGERLKKELEERARTRSSYHGNIKVYSPPKRSTSVWNGGALLASIPAFRGTWVTKAAYEEYGPNVVHMHEQLHYT